MSTKDVIDLEDIKLIAVRACDNDESIEVIEHQLKPYSKHNLGFLGQHQKLEITVRQKDSETVKLSFFVKFVPEKSKAQSEFIQDHNIFKQEAEYFNKITPHFYEIMEAAKIEDWAPKCYLASDNIIVQQDIRTLGYSMCDTKILKGDFLKATAKALARLHASSILAEKRLGKPFNELYPKAFAEQLFSEISQKHGLGLFESLVSKPAKKHERNMDKISDCMNRIFEFVRLQKGKNKVICHGDAWNNNTMFDSSVPPKCLLVDYQMIRYAPRMIDVAQLIYLNTTKKIRENEEKGTIEAYWKELCDCIRRYDPSIETPSLDDLLEEYEKAKIVGQIIAVIYYPTILLSKEVYEEHNNDVAAVLKKFVFRRNNDAIFELMDRDEEYNQRISEAVLEFLDSCKKLEAPKTEQDI